jgi:hypothetical protein
VRNYIAGYGGKMRILVASPPKTGNFWIKALLSESYNLKILTPEPGDDVRDLEKFIEQGLFKDNSIFHQHYWPTNRLFRLANSSKIDIVSIIRNPYDTLVSLFYYVQNFPEVVGPGHPLFFIHGKKIDAPEIIDFIKRIEGGFGIHLQLAFNWIYDGRSIVVRYEDLKKDTFGTLKSITERLCKIDDNRIQNAIDAASASKMRQRNDVLSRHIRKASVGDWRNHLTEDHLKVFRENYRELIEKIGYQVA